VDPDPTLDPLEDEAVVVHLRRPGPEATEAPAAEEAPSRGKRIFTVEELDRLADEAADLDTIVRRELAHLQHEPSSIRDLPTVWPVRRRWPARALVALSVLGMAAIVASNLRGSEDRPHPGRVSPATSGAPVKGSAPPTPAPPARIKELSVELSFSAPCWVNAVADGRTVLSETFTQGVERVRARHEVELTLGNAGGVSVTVSGEPVRTGGGSGDVVTLTFTLKKGEVKITR
jgi:hypothetical protein